MTPTKMRDLALEPAGDPQQSRHARAIPLAILRGGTSRGVFFLASDLPADREAIEAILLNVLGSPDIRQIDGVGGASSQTSKAAIIGPATRPDADIDYTFAQVSIDRPLVDWGGNCGNLSSAVGPFAVNRGLVPAEGSQAEVRIHNTNTGKIIVAEVPLQGGQSAVTGDFSIPGVPGAAARLRLRFTEPAGSFAGTLLPTGHPCDEVTLRDGRRLDVSVVDAANPVVFLRAADLGLKGTELPPEIEAQPEATATLEEVRGIVASWLGIVDDPAEATRRSPGLPKVGFVAPPADYVTTTGEQVMADQMDVLGRLMSMQTAHRSYMVTGGICTATAACVDGTVVHEAARPSEERPANTVRIAHPYGVMEAEVETEGGSGSAPDIRSVTIDRTARHIIDGVVYVPADLIKSGS